MKILVLGGTRFFGRDIVRQLQERGDAVTVLTRGRLEAPPGVEHLRGDRNETSVLAEAAARRFDAVIDNVAFTREHIRAVLDAFSGRTGHYVFTSSGAVYMLEGRPPYWDDGAPPPPREGLDPKEWGYTINKIEAERELFEGRGLPFTIVRPPVVIGPHDYTLRLHFYVQRILDGGPLLLLDGGKHCFQLADSVDLAWSFVRILELRERVFGAAFNVCQRDVLSLEELVIAAAGALGKSPKIAPIPSSLLARLDFEYPEPLGPYPQPMILPPERAIRELGFRPRPVLDSVASAARWHAEHSRENSAGYERRPRELEIATRLEASMARWVEELRPSAGA